jgi:hypothetical protein
LFEGRRINGKRTSDQVSLTSSTNPFLVESLKTKRATFGFFCCPLTKKKTVCLSDDTAFDLRLFEEERSKVDMGDFETTIVLLHLLKDKVSKQNIFKNAHESESLSEL